ncbi:MAG TPA: CHASE2 domain-containing protein [Candidatus Angelobacter sp.]|nr:CHASE2 domain-containing protein [Candidatus Angelobacter sp.]
MKHLPIPNDAPRVTLARWVRLNLILLGLVGLVSVALPVSTLSEKLSDFYFRLRTPRPTSSQVALVMIDEVTLARYGRWPWHRAQLAQLIRAVAAQQPRAIGLDVLLPEPEDQANDAALTQAIQATPNMVLVSKISSSPNGNLWIDPQPQFLAVAAGVGHAQAIIDLDGVCRSIPLEEPSADGMRPAFALKLASMVQPQLAAMIAPSETETSGTQRLEPRAPFVIDFRRQFTPGQEPPPFVVESAADLLSGKSAPKLAGRVALIGFGSTEVSDRLVTPVSDQLPMPGVEINANVADMLLAGRSLIRLGIPEQVLVVVLASAIFLWLVVRLPGARGLFLLTAILVAGYFAAFFVFLYLHHMVSYGPLVVAGVLAAPLAQLENLLIVEREVTLRLQHLRQAIQPHYGQVETSAHASAGSNPSACGRLHWKLAALKDLQAKLSSLNAFNETLLETMSEGLAVFGADGTLRFSNTTWKQFCRRHNVVLDRLSGIAELAGGWRDLASLTHDSAAWTEHEAPLGEELWLLRAVRLPWTSFAEAGAVMLMAEDITARRQRDQARSEALSFVTHELRTPLLSIQGFSEVLMRYPNSPASSEAPATIFRETNRLVAMINTYLEVLRLDSGARPLHRSRTNVNAMVAHVEKVVRPLAASANVSVRVEVNPAVDSLVCDETLVAGALLNLVSNAIKYGMDGSEVLLRVNSQENEVTFEVRNSGPAIPAAELEHIFERFYRPARSESIPGWGLGLSFVRRICQQHGGRVHVNSNEISGTSFAFTLPRGAREVLEVAP